ncbi:MAG: alpha/beta fold hydrolase [Polyangia bacterium]
MRVVLLPGLDGTGALFEPLQRALSCPATVVSYGSATTEADHLACVALPDEPFVLVAESFSGSIAVQLADTPNLVALVLVATFMRSPSVLPRWLGWLLAPVAAVMMTWAWLVRALLFSGQVSDDALERTRAVLTTVPRAAIIARLRIVFRRDTMALLAATKLPVLYVQALRDRLVPPRAGRAMQAALPTMQRATIDAPHLVLQQRPAESAALIESFIDRIAKA